MDAAIAENEMVFCRGCGKKLHKTAISCPACGAVQAPAGSGASDKRILPALLLCTFLGLFGVHRFYAGKAGTGILQFFTFGGIGVWTLVDFVMIVSGGFTDGQGKKISLWT